jgi:3-deoxy-manno-octulosonate cytidylyltransferase (CMP-KDO synthetase)
MNYTIIIPARYASTRLPGKPLLNIKGKPMIQHVYERAKQTSAQSVIIATDDERIQKVAIGFGAQVCMTSSNHLTGTDRIAEVVEQLVLADNEIVVNLQGDLPGISPQVVEQVALNLYQQPQAAMATLCYPLQCQQDLLNPSVVKVVKDKLGFALYFSRASIPNTTHQQQNQTMTKQDSFQQHFGLYAYRASVIREYGKLPTCPLEQLESLEQLRLLWHGYKIHVGLALQPPPGEVNTPEDLAKMNDLVTEV